MIPYANPARDHNVRTDETVTADLRMMTNVIPAPHYDIVANLCERL
jgi:hypothetical protein